MSIDGTFTGTRRLRIRLFAGARERAGEEFVEITVPRDAAIRDARRCLGNDVPALADHAPFLLFAIGTEYADDGERIPEDCELVAFPPVSGG